MKSRPSKPSDAPRDWSQEYLKIAGVILIAINPDETVALINRKGCEVLGYPEEEIVGYNWFDFFLPVEVREHARQLFRRLITGRGFSGEFEYFENPVLTRTGELKLVAWHNTILRGDDGSVAGTLSSGEDITQRRAGEESLRAREAELRAIVDTAVDGIVTIDQRGRIQSFNPAATRLFGYEPEEVIGRNVSILMPPPDSRHHDEYLSRYAAGAPARIIGLGREVLGKRKDGSVFPFYLAVSEVKLRDKVFFTGILHDLSEFKKMQEQMLSSQNLAAIGELAATVAHEIKNPLAGISGAIQVLNDTFEASDPRREVMGEILGQVRRLDETVRELLMLSKPWTPERQPCRISDVVRQTVSLAEEERAFKRIEFQMEGDLEVSAKVDRSMFEQVLWNLLQNSAQAINGAGSIRLVFSSSPTTCTLHVIDNGPGIPSAVQNKLFRPFVTTKTAGTGLGLTICKKIMEAHEGSISVESSPEKGTAITLSFPRGGV